MCETPSWRLKPQLLPPTPHKHLYLCNDHHTKGAWWFLISLKTNKHNYHYMFVFYIYYQRYLSLSLSNIDLLFVKI